MKMEGAGCGVKAVSGGRCVVQDGHFDLPPGSPQGVPWECPSGCPSAVPEDAVPVMSSPVAALVLDGDLEIEVADPWRDRVVCPDGGGVLVRLT